MQSRTICTGLAFCLFWGVSPVWAQQDDMSSAVTDLGSTTSEATADSEDHAALPTRTIEAKGKAVADAPILTVNQERLYEDSAWGQRAQRELGRKGGEIAEENDRIAAQLSAEEAQLTQKRAALAPAEFRKLAEAFDARATSIRRERAQMVQRLNAEAEADRAAFFQAALQVMGEVMQERGAVAVLDRRTVFVSLDAIDITTDLIERLNMRIGDGSRPDEASTPDAATQSDN